VFDGTGIPVAQAMCDALGGGARQADPFELADGADCAVVLLPMWTPGLPDSGSALLATIDSVCADPAVRFTSGIVVVWFVPRDRRAQLAAARTVAGRTVLDAWNGAGLMLGTSWRRELHHHDGDQAAATACRSRQVERLLRATSHTELGEPDLRTLCRTLHRLDARFVHAVVPEVVEHTDDGTRRGWAGVESVAAAVRYRLGLDDPVN
jgi:hypothetical protein